MWLARMFGRVLLSYSRMHMAHFLQISGWFAKFQFGQRGDTLVLHMIISLIHRTHTEENLTGIRQKQKQ